MAKLMVYLPDNLYDQARQTSGLNYSQIFRLALIKELDQPKDPLTIIQEVNSLLGSLKDLLEKEN